MLALGYRSTRGINGVNGKKLAEGINVSFPMVRRYITGQSLPENKTLTKIAEYLETDPWWLLYGHKESNTEEKNQGSTKLIVSIFEKLYPLLKKRINNKNSFISLIRDGLDIHTNVNQIDGSEEAQDNAISLMVDFLQKKI